MALCAASWLGVTIGLQDSEDDFKNAYAIGTRLLKWI